MELEPCPVCGATKGLYVLEDHHEFEWYVFCDNCKTFLGNEYAQTKEDAIKHWNTRVSCACYADEVTNRNCKYSVNRGWCERTCRNAAVTPLAFRCGKCGWFDKNRCDFNYCPNCGAKVVE